MKKENKFLGCFISSDIDDPVSDSFVDYVYGSHGVSNLINKLSSEKYGNDLKIILFQFYVNPDPYLLEHLKEIENYRKKEKAIGIPIIINESNFFNKSHSERILILKKRMLDKMDLLSEVIKRKKLDTKMDLLIDDLKVLLTLGV